jgi:hypothetical protein
MGASSVLQPPRILCVNHDPANFLRYREAWVEKAFVLETTASAGQKPVLARRVVPDPIEKIVLVRE